jgi:hypothetical protein
MQGVDDEEAPAMAGKIEEENPGWIVVFGVFSRQFVCFPRFPVPKGTMVVARYPEEALTRMRAIERFCAREGRGLEGIRERSGVWRMAAEGT